MWWLSTRLTCRTRPSGSLLWLCGSVPILLPTFASSGAGGADAHLADFEERHHKRLLLQWTVTAHKPRLLEADALSCLRGHNILCYVVTLCVLNVRILACNQISYRCWSPRWPAGPGCALGSSPTGCCWQWCQTPASPPEQPTTCETPAGTGLPLWEDMGEVRKERKEIKTNTGVLALYQGNGIITKWQEDG